MKKSIFISAILLYIGISSAFANSSSVNSENQQDVKNIFANDVVYRGLLPCADCGGIKVLLKFGKNSTFSKDSLYLTKTPEMFKDSGKYKIDGNKITTINTNGETHKYLFENGVLKMLNADDKVVKGELADYYNLFLLDKQYYKGYYKQFIKNLGEANKTQSMVINKTDKINVIFYRDLKDTSVKCDFKGEGKFKDGILYATNDNNQTISLNLIDESSIYIKEQISPEKRSKIYSKICQHGSLNGVYNSSISLSQLISKDSIGFINKFTKVSEIEKNIPDRQLEKVKNGGITTFIVKSTDQKPLFSFISKNDEMKSVQVLSKQYQTPQGISLKSTFGELKSKMTIDNMKMSGNDIYVYCMDFNMVVVFKKDDLTDKRVEEFTLDSIKDNARISKIILEW